MSRLLLGLAFVLGGCSLTGGSGESTDDLILSSGSSFGECLGYCVATLVVDGRTATLTYLGWTGGGTLPDVEHRITLEADERADLDDALDLDALLRAEAAYGCPDCVDGGAEWVAADLESGTKQVTFEYGTEAGGLDAYIEAMRDLRARFPEAPRDWREGPEDGRLGPTTRR